MKVKDALKVKSFSYNKLNVQKWIYTSFKWNLLPKTHIVDRYMETVESFGVKNDGAGLDYFIAREDVINESDLPTSHSAGYVGVVIGAALNTKKYPFHHVKNSVNCWIIPLCCWADWKMRMKATALPQ